MAQDKALFLREWTVAAEKNVSQLQETATLLVSKETKSTIKNEQFASTLKDISSRELGRSSAAAYKLMADKLVALEAERAKVVSQLEHHMVQKFSGYPNRVKMQKDNVSKRNAVYDRVVTRQKRLAGLNTKSKRDEAAIARARTELNEETVRLKQAEVALNNQVVDFEREKLRDLRDSMSRYVESQLFFHARALEDLTVCFHALAAIDVESDARDVSNKLLAVSGQSADDTGLVLGPSPTPGAPQLMQQPTVASLHSASAPPVLQQGASLQYAPSLQYQPSLGMASPSLQAPLQAGYSIQGSPQVLQPPLQPVGAQYNQGLGSPQVLQPPLQPVGSLMYQAQMGQMVPMQNVGYQSGGVFQG